jgi:hypothetical protein
MSRHIRRSLPVLGFAIGSALCGQEDPKASGPATLLIQYDCPPANRPRLREVMVARGLPRLATLKSSGALENYLVLFSRYVDSSNWDMLTLLSFRDYKDAVAWKEVELQTPAGLDSSDLQVTSEVHTYPLDRVRHDNASATGAPNAPVYLVIPYSLAVPAAAYLNYFDDYVQPQMEGWIREGVLAHYDLLLQRYTAARPWDSLLILQYRDDAALGRRESVVARVRQQLQTQPKWKALSESKQTIRIEKAAIIADELRADELRPAIR